MGWKFALKRAAACERESNKTAGNAREYWRNRAGEWRETAAKILRDNGKVS